MGIDAKAELDRIKAEQAAAFYGRRYGYITASDGYKMIGVFKGLGDTYIVGYFRETGSRRALKVKALWPTRHADNLQERLDKWASEKGLREVPTC